MKIVYVDKSYLTEPVMDNICARAITTHITPQAVKNRLEFRDSAFMNLVGDNWFPFTQLRDSVVEELQDVDLVLNDQSIVLRFNSNYVNGTTLGILMVMLQEYGWADFTIRKTGFVKWREGGVSTNTDSWEMCLTHVIPKPVIRYCNQFDHYYVQARFRDEIEPIVGITGYCSDADRAVLNDKQYAKLKEHLNDLA